MCYFQTDKQVRSSADVMIETYIDWFGQQDASVASTPPSIVLVSRESSGCHGGTEAYRCRKAVTKR